MTTKTAMRLSIVLVLPLLLLGVASPARAAEPVQLSIKNITMVPIPPTCEVRATKKHMRSGGTLSIVWKSDDAVKMTGLVQGDQEWPADGRQRISIAVPGKHLFPLTFTGKNGTTATCTAKVFVKPKKIR